MPLVQRQPCTNYSSCKHEPHGSGSVVQYLIRLRSIQSFAGHTPARGCLLHSMHLDTFDTSLRLLATHLPASPRLPSLLAHCADTLHSVLGAQQLSLGHVPGSAAMGLGQSKAPTKKRVCVIGGGAAGGLAADETVAKAVKAVVAARVPRPAAWPGWARCTPSPPCFCYASRHGLRLEPVALPRAL